MAHKKIIDSVKKQGQVAIKDLDEFLRFIINESDMRTYDDNYISILIPMKFDIDKVFGLDVCKRSDDDYVILYSCWYPNKDVFGRQFEMRLYHYDNSNDDDDPYEYHDNEGVESISDIADNLLSPTYRKAIIKALQDKQEYYAEDEFYDANIAERAKDILDNLAEIFGSDEQED